MRAFLFFASTLCTISFGSRVHQRDFDLDMLEFSQGYNFLDPPPMERSGTPLLVNFQINLRNVLGINELDQTISLETSIRMYWRDPRVILTKRNVEYQTFNPELMNNVFWIPDVFVDGAKDIRSPKYQLRPSSLRVYHDSTIRFSSRVNFDVHCPMVFQRFPSDVQDCDVKLESFGYTTKEVLYQWTPQGNDLNQNISLPNFDFSIETNESYNTKNIYSLSYPGVSMKIRLQRKLMYHVLQTYVPSIMLVILSWFSFFMPIEEVPGRVGMSTMSLVTLMALYSVIRKEVPQVSYMSLLDLWMFTSMAFVVLILFHYVLLSYAIFRHHKKNVTDKIDIFGRWGISCLFLTFCSIYWSVLMF